MFYPSELLEHIAADPLHGLTEGEVSSHPPTAQRILRSCLTERSVYAAHLLGGRQGLRLRKDMERYDNAYMCEQRAQWEAMGWRVIKAKWSGTCPVTHTRWVEGGYIWWCKGMKAQAVDCNGMYVEAYGNVQMVGL